MSATRYVRASTGGRIENGIPSPAGMTAADVPSGVAVLPPAVAGVSTLPVFNSPGAAVAKMRRLLER